jgi:hypothetical protein
MDIVSEVEHCRGVLRGLGAASAREIRLHVLDGYLAVTGHVFRARAALSMSRQAAREAKYGEACGHLAVSKSVAKRHS